MTGGDETRMLISSDKNNIYLYTTLSSLNVHASSQSLCLGFHQFYYKCFLNARIVHIYEEKKLLLDDKAV